MKQKKKFGCGTIVWIVIGLMVISVLIRAFSGGRDKQENAENSKKETVENSTAEAPEQEKHFMK